MGDRVWHSPWSIFRKTLLSPRISFSYSSYCTRSGTRLLCFALLTYNCNYTATHAHCAVQEEFHVWRALNGIQGKGRQATRLSAVARSIALTCLASTLPVLPKQCLTARSVAILSWFSGLLVLSEQKFSTSHRRSEFVPPSCRLRNSPIYITSYLLEKPTAKEPNLEELYLAGNLTLKAYAVSYTHLTLPTKA